MFSVRCRAAAAQSIVEIPFEEHAQRLFVPVTLGTHGPYWFILDTGAGTCVIDTAVARATGLASVPNGSTTGAGAGAMATRRGEPVTLTVGTIPVRVSAPVVSAIDAQLRPYQGRPVPGIIGGDFFAGRVIEIDFARHVIGVHPPTANVARAGDVTVPIRIEGVPHAMATLTDAAGRTDTLDVIVDLGAKHALHATERTVARLELERRFPRNVYTPVGAGVGGETRYRMTRAAGISLGGASAATARGALLAMSADGTMRNTSYDALLGIGYLGRFRVVIDYPHGRVLLSPTLARDVPEPFDRSGLFAIADGGVLRVTFVVPGSPAAESGMAPGDTVAALDGKPLVWTDLDVLRDALSDPVRLTVRLTVRHGTTREVALQLRDLLR